MCFSSFLFQIHISFHFNWVKNFNVEKKCFFSDEDVVKKKMLEGYSDRKFYDAVDFNILVFT